MRQSSAFRPRGGNARRKAITATGATEVAALGALVALVEARQMGGRYEPSVYLTRPRPRIGRPGLPGDATRTGVSGAPLRLPQDEQVTAGVR